MVGANNPPLSASGELVKDKTTIRYIGFRSANDGGRIFDFSVSGPEHNNLLSSVEIPNEFFAGPSRIQLQEGVGISYAILKHLVEINAPAEVPPLLCLTASDLARYREPLPEPKRRSGFTPPGQDWKEMLARKTP